MADAGYLTIGKVVSKLQEQYPDLSVSKVRYLEDEGLLTPSRTPGGYRLYSARDIQRLETILYLQKSRFLPLSVIKDELDGNKGGTDSTPEDCCEATSDPVDPSLSVSPEAERELHPIDRIPEVAGVPISLVRKLADCSIIKLVKSPAGRDLVRGSDLRLIRACNELTRFGIEPKNLRQYLAAANREIPMFEQALASLSRHQGETPNERRLRREVALDRMLTLTGVVRGSIMRRELIDD
ncbi:MerR family transcriptional regulator [uncultured Parolsenella sp.]|uniref:transcriptional regulator FtsR n=1 Tax=uncultured Parolsenella sp. TaxID=2083008 RepID=UPI0025F2C61D|nr:MerR family transcriptional regulator [uncultured Parolsenella sp.]